MPDGKISGTEKVRSKLKEGRRDKEKAKETGGEETKTNSSDVPLRRQVDLFHFYKKRRSQETDVQSSATSHTTTIEVEAGDDILNHEEANALYNRDTLNLVKVPTERSMDGITSTDETPFDLYLVSKGTKPNNASPPEPQIDIPANSAVKIDDIPNAPSNLWSASGDITTSSSTDCNLAVQQRPNTSFPPLIEPLTLIPASVDQSFPTRCAVLPASPFPLSFSTHQILQSPSQPDGLSSGLPSRSPLFLTSRFVSDQNKEVNVAGDVVDQSKKKDSIQGDMTDSCLASSEEQNVGENLEEETLLRSPTAAHDDPIHLLFAPSSASTEYRLNTGEISGRESEKGLRRCGGLDEEVSVSMHTTSKNIDTNMPVLESINAINLPAFAPNRLVAEDAGDLISSDKLHFPHVIDLTDSPESKLGPPTNPYKSLRTRHRPIPRIAFSQGTSIEQNTTSADGIGNSNRNAFSPPPGSQEKPIELFSPLKSAIKVAPASVSRPQSPPSKTVPRELGRKHVKIHPFFQRTANSVFTSSSATNVSGHADEDVNNLNLGSVSNTNTGGPAKVQTEKGKRNKDKSGDEERCDNDEGDEEADVILSQYARERAPFRDLTFGLSDSTSALRSNSIAVGATHPPRRSVLSQTQVLQARWPNSENQHVTKSHRLKEGGHSPFPKRIKSTSTSKDRKAEKTVSLAKQLGLKDERETVSDPRFRMSFCHRAESSNSTIQNAIESIPNEHREHPRISRIISLIKQSNEKGRGRKTEDADAEMPPDNSMWTTKWKPRHAAEVLGNESQALYLREWLKSLAIRDQERPAADTEDEGKEGTQKKRNRSKNKKEPGLKRRVVIRSISKRKRRRIGSEEDEDEDMSWIVDDDGEEDEDEERTGKDEGDWTPNEGKSQGSDHNNNLYGEDFTKRLTNTILLAGAPGTGKTSAVYVCAEELGWEVFEVHPGIGRRTGLNIAGLIGDVGKNHIVGKGIRQSIILLEEVDILFKEDTNFWTSVVNIISTSHRPVIMTCNGEPIWDEIKKTKEIEFELVDASLVPQKDLPLQRCLNFEACPCGLASSFLQAVCIAERQDVTRERVAEEYALLGGDEPEWPPSIAFPSQALPSADLRKALNRLQLGLRFPDPQQGCSGGWRECKEFGKHTLNDCEFHAENASYVNAYIDRRIEEKPGFETQGDDEIGYTMLNNPDKSECSGMGTDELNKCSYNYSMACDALACCRHVGDGIPFTNWTGSQTLSDSRHRWLIQTRRHLTRQAASFLDELISLPGPLLPRSEATLEYIPVVRWLVALDDARGVLPNSSARRRWRHVRYLDLSKEALGAVREYYEMFFPRCIT